MAKEKAESVVPTDKLSKLTDFINKEYGEGSIFRGDAKIGQLDVIPTGITSLDIALGVGGYGRGRIVEIYGPEASGKTQLTLLAIAEVQKAGGTAAFIDAEHALDPSFAKLNGVNMETLLISQPDTGEQGLEIADCLVKSGIVDLVVIDSVSALVPKAEIEGDMGQAHVGLQARMMSQALRKLTASAQKSKTTIMFINQLRMKIGVMFGSPETTTGGNALKFYASIRLDVRKIGTLKDGENVSGHRAKVKVVKNKLSPPFKECEFDNVYGVGVNTVGDLLDLATGFGLVDKSGAWYSMGERRLGQGRDKTVEALKADPELLSSIERDLKEHLLAK